MTITPPPDIIDQLERQGFKALPTGTDGTQVALHFSNDNGVVCCDILVYREVAEEGKTLHEEATCLLQSLRQLQNTLCSHSHHFDSHIQSRVISFLGTKAHLLTNDAGQLIHCRLHPLIILTPAHIAPSPKTLASIYPIHVIRATELESFLSNTRTTKISDPITSQKSLKLLQKAYQYLGFSLLLFPVLVGLAGLLLGIGYPFISIPLAMGGFLGPLLLLHKSRSAFHQFRLHNSISLLPPTALQTKHPSVDPPVPSPTAELPTIPTETPPQSNPPSTFWTTTTTAAHLQDMINTAIKAALNAYRTKNWKAFSEHARALLFTGLRMGILKKTGHTLPDDALQILDHVNPTETRDHLRAWVHRLAITRHQHPLTLEEAQQLMNFTVQLLRQQHAILPSSEYQIFQVIPRLTNLAPPVTILTGDPVPVTPHDAALDSSLPSIDPIDANIIPITGLNQTPRSNGFTKGVPLQVLSLQDLKVLFELIQNGASPYLLIFTQRFATSWQLLQNLVDQVANQLSSQINIVVFPDLGDSECDFAILKYFRLFHLEGHSAPPDLPFLCVLTRQLLLHVTEDNLPVPPELIVEPHPDAFLDRVQDAILLAQTYQLEHQPLVLTQIPATEITNSPELSEPPLTMLKSTLLTSPLIADTDDVIKEVANAPTNIPHRQVMELDLTAAEEHRELATLVPAALAVVHLPQDQPLIDALEETVAIESNLIAQFIDTNVYPLASERLQIPAGSVRLRFNGSERLLTQPNTEHLLANIRQLRGLQQLPTLNGHSVNYSKEGPENNSRTTQATTTPRRRLSPKITEEG